MPTTSTGLRPSARRNRSRHPSCPRSAESIVAARLGTFSHLDVCWHDDRLGHGQPLHIGRGLNGALVLAIERQAYRDARAGAEPAADRDLTAMQLDQTLHD